MSHEINPYLPNEQTLRMQSFAVEGNVIDHSWYHIVKKETGKTDHLAVSILAEIVYWYRPSFHKDEVTGEVKMFKKFKKDILQKSYLDLQKQFGISKEQARDALITLERLGICERETRIENFGGNQVPNILFIRFHDQNLKKLTESYYSDNLKSEPLGSEISHPIIKKQQPYVRKFPSNTKNTLETSLNKQQQEPKQNDENFGVVFFDILKNLDIKDSQKEWLTKNYDEETVTHAVTYALNPNLKIKEGLIQTIKWACKEKPDLPKNKEDKEKVNKELAENLQKDAVVPLGYKLDVLNKYVEISGGSQNSFVLLYSDSSFKSKFKEAIKKYGIKPK